MGYASYPPYQVMIRRIQQSQVHPLMKSHTKILAPFKIQMIIPSMYCILLGSRKGRERIISPCTVYSWDKVRLETYLIPGETLIPKEEAFGQGIGYASNPEKRGYVH